jgi:transcriptional regulator with XRE-family HTH domain
METNNPDNQMTREDLLDDLTLDVIEQMQRGEKVNFGEYAARYPDLAQDLQSSVARYLFEDQTRLQQIREELAAPEYIANIRKAQADPAEQSRINAQVAAIMGLATPSEAPAISSLYKLGAEKGIKPTQLAQKVGLNPDLMMRLERRTFRVGSLPAELLKRLAQTLEVSIQQIAAYLSYSPAAASAQHLNQDKPQELKQQDFAQAVKDTQNLPADQKKFWLEQTQSNPYEV